MHGNRSLVALAGPLLALIGLAVALSGCGSSLESIAGVQYSRMNAPIGVPGPTWVRSSFSSGFSIVDYCGAQTSTGRISARCC